MARGGSVGGRTDLPRVIAARYRLDHEIAEGGMGVVYRAHQLDLERDVAIKLVSSRMAEQDPSFAERFHLEAASLARLSHANVVTVHDYGRTDAGELFIVMEYIDGAPLSAVVDRDGPISFTRILRIALDIARALRAAHAIGVVHRDLKPANVMISRDEDERDLVKVLDFGLAKLLDVPGQKRDVNLTQTPTLLGSPKYMAPEQACGDPAAPSADIYSLGAVLYFMAAGTPPFQGSSASEIVRHHLRTPVPPLHTSGYRRACPPEVEALIMRCLEKQAADRFASMQEVIGAVKQAYGAVSRHAAGMSLPPEPRTHRRWEPSDVIFEAPELSESGYKAIDPAVLEDRGFLAKKGDPTSPLFQELPHQAAAFNSLEVPLVSPVRHKKASRRRNMLAGVLVGVVIGSLALGVVANQVGVQQQQEAADHKGTEARVRFESTPAGAKVSENGAILGVTPFVAILPRTGDALHKFTLEKSGYLPTIVMVALDRAKISVATELEASQAQVEPPKQ